MTDTQNRVLTMAEVLALPEGARVWVEARYDCRFDSEHFKGKKDGNNDVLRRVDNPDKGCWLKNHYVNETFRVWSLPQPPTQEEMEKWPWEVRE